MQQAEQSVAVANRVADNAYGEQIVDLVDRDLLRAKLLLNGVEPLDSRLDAALNVVLLKDLLDQQRHDPVEEGLAFAAQRVYFGQ